MAHERQNLLTATEVAGWLNVPKSTVYKLCQEGRIPAARIGRHWRFDRLAVQRWLESNISGCEPPDGNQPIEES